MQKLRRTVHYAKPWDVAAMFHRSRRLTSWICHLTGDIRQVSVIRQFIYKGATTGGGGRAPGPLPPQKSWTDHPNFYVAVHETAYTIRILFYTIT